MALVRQAFEQQGEEGYEEPQWSQAGVEHVVEQAADPAMQQALLEVVDSAVRNGLYPRPCEAEPDVRAAGQPLADAVHAEPCATTTASISGAPPRRSRPSSRSSRPRSSASSGRRPDDAAGRGGRRPGRPARRADGRRGGAGASIEAARRPGTGATSTSPSATLAWEDAERYGFVSGGGELVYPAAREPLARASRLRKHSASGLRRRGRGRRVGAARNRLSTSRSTARPCHSSRRRSPPSKWAREQMTVYAPSTSFV